MNLSRTGLTSFLGALLITTVSAVPSMADDMGTMNPMSGMSSGMDSSPSSGSVGHGKGEIKAIDRSAGTVTIKHGPIKEFGWSAMTMTFPLVHRSALKTLKKGAHVRFDVQRKEDGSVVITAIEKE